MAVTPPREYEDIVREEEVIQAAAMPLAEVPTCMTLFDRWASCFALGPQLRSVYRYGSLKDCTDKLDDFKYCLTLKSMSPEERRTVWIRRRAELAASQRIASSSESVWELRRDPLIGSAHVDSTPTID